MTKWQVQLWRFETEEAQLIFSVDISEPEASNLRSWLDPKITKALENQPRLPNEG